MRQICGVSRVALAAAVAAIPADRQRKEAGGGGIDFKSLFREHSDAVEVQLKGIGVDVDTMKQQLRELEQKGARRGGGDDIVESFGAQMARSERFKAFQANRYEGSLRMSFKAITAAQAPANFSARDTDIVGLPRRSFRVRDLLTTVPTTSGSVDYARQTTRTNNAAPVAEGALKPTSTYVWDQVNIPVRTIAHITKITRQALDDSDQLQGEVDSEMRYGLGLAEETELLTGDGSGQHLTGLIPAATGFTAPITITSPNMIDNIGLAVLQLALTDHAADGIVLNPADWMHMRLLKDADGKYILGDPQANVTPTLFGLPVATTQAMTIDKFLVGGFKLQKLYDRMEPEVLIASENEDDFVKNLLTMRCEERLALAVRKPTALIYGDFGNVA